MKLFVIVLTIIDFLIMLPIILNALKKFPYKKIFKMGKEENLIVETLNKNALFKMSADFNI